MTTRTQHPSTEPSGPSSRRSPRPRLLALAVAASLLAASPLAIPARMAIATPQPDAEPSAQGAGPMTAEPVAADQSASPAAPTSSGAQAGLAPMEAEDDGTFRAVVHASWTDAEGAEIAWPEGTVVTVDLLEGGKVIDEGESRQLGYVDGELHTGNEFSADCIKDRAYTVSVRSVTPEPSFAYEVATEAAFDEYGQLAFSLTFKKAAEDQPAPEEPEAPQVTATLSATAQLIEYEKCPIIGAETVFEIQPHRAKTTSGKSRSAMSPGTRHMANGPMGQAISFDPITFTEPGIYSYRIRQRNRGGISRITYDTLYKWAQVRVVKKGDALEAIVTYGEQQGDCTQEELIVTNTYGRPQIDKDAFFSVVDDEPADAVRIDKSTLGDKGIRSAISGVSVGLLIRIPQDAERVVISDPVLEARYVSTPDFEHASNIIDEIFGARIIRVDTGAPTVADLLTSRAADRASEENDLVARRYAYPIVEGYGTLAEAAGSLDAQAEASSEPARLVVDIPDATELRDQWVYVEYHQQLAADADLEQVAAALEVPATLDVYNTDEEGNLEVSTVSVSNVPAVSVPEQQAPQAEEKQEQPTKEDAAPSPKANAGQGEKASATRATSTASSSLPKTADHEPANAAIAVAMASAGTLLALLGLMRRRPSEKR